MPKPAEQSNCLVIGAGIAGLAFALQWAEAYAESKVVVLNKGDWTSSNTWLAQGGIAAVSAPEDSFDQHRQDTLEAGHYRSDSAMVEEVVKMGPDAIDQLEQWGVDFDRDENGRFHLGKEGGHSRHRIVHHKDATGKTIIQQLQRRVEQTPNIRIYHNFQVINLITTSPTKHQHVNPRLNSCQGAYGQDLATGAITAFQAPVTYLATGGSGQVFAHTTNNVAATGDGPALAIRAGLELRDMGYYQFHPTALYQPNAQRKLLISEALRGAGAEIVDENGFPFLEKFDDRGSLAPRDVVCQGIQRHLKATNARCVYLDASGIQKAVLDTHFPEITKICRRAGLDFPQSPIPIIPVAHYQCGGIPVNKWGQTKLPGFYAGGECAYTGVHGANRLASNSLLEGLAMAHFSFEHWRKNREQKEVPRLEMDDKFDNALKKQTADPDLLKANRQKLQNLMSDCAGLEMDDRKLEEDYQQIKALRLEHSAIGAWGNSDWVELENMLTTAEAIVKDKLAQVKDDFAGKAKVPKMS